MSTLLSDITPNLLQVAPGETCRLSVRITNSTSVIDAYQVSIFGLDPNWVTTSPSRLSLFPGEAGDVEVTIELPIAFPAGHRQLSVHIRSENDPAAFGLTPLGLVALGQPRLAIRADPVMIIGGKDATFGLIVTNEGNTTIEAVPSASDPEEMTQIQVVPPELTLPPGHQEVVQVTVRGKRPWVGAPKVRTITFAVDATTRVEAIATFMQKPRIGRWALSLMGLLAAAAVFAIVLSRVFDNVVNESSVDKGLLSKALDKGATGGQTTPVNPGVVTGKVVLFSTREGVAGVQAELFAAGDTKIPLASAATGDGGAYTFGRLNAGSYKIRFSGAGFEDTWYEAGATAADAKEVKVELGKTAALNDVELGGRPGVVKGTVASPDLTDIKATLVVPPSTAGGSDVPAEVRTVDVAADGSFVFDQVPSPARYQLVVKKVGYATETRDVVLGPAQTVENIDIVLRKGNGTMTGRINDLSGPLGGATIEATDGANKITTVSLTDGDVGAFALRALTNGQTYTLTITRAGYTTETRTVPLTTAAVDAGTITLSKSTGSIAGTVSQNGMAALGGVTVTINAGTTTVTTFSASSGMIGAYFVDGLPIPATYTVTFSGAGLVSQVRVQDLDPANSTADSTGVDVSLARSTALVQGIVHSADGTALAGATVVLSDGTTSRTLVTANDPVGRFAFSTVSAGTYTLTATLPGTTAAVRLVTVTADNDQDLDITIAAQASVTGQVLLFSDTTGTYVPLPGATVRLFNPPDFPGAPSAAVQTAVTDANGNYTFTALPAPKNFVIAVYQTAASADALDSQLILTQPSTQLTAAPFNIPVLF